MKELKLSITHYKIMLTVRWLNDQKLYPNQEGVYKIVHGDIDEEMRNYVSCPTFGCMVSYNSKKICRYILALTRYGYLTKIFDRESEELYITLTEKGKIAQEDYFRKHKIQFMKRNRKKKPTIVKIG